MYLFCFIFVSSVCLVILPMAVFKIIFTNSAMWLFSTSLSVLMHNSDHLACVLYLRSVGGHAILISITFSVHHLLSSVYLLTHSSS